MRVAIIGCGSIGSYIARSIASGCIPRMQLVALADAVETPGAKETAARCGCPFTTQVGSLTTFGSDLVIEAASQDAARQWVPFFLAAGCDVMVMSVGALADDAFLSRVLELAERQGRRIYVPSGAIGGLDVIKAAGVGEIREVILTTTKPASALSAAPFVIKRGLDLNGLTEPAIIYEGPAAEAVKEFPQNVNVAAALSLAGIGPRRTLVRIVAHPNSKQNIHEVYVRGEFGEATFRLANVPSPNNPRTSYLACLSAVATLRRIASPLQVGT